MIERANKEKAYEEIVARRQACRLCDSSGMINPSRCEGGIYDKRNHVGPWTQWQGNLNAELMVVGQDWGGTDYYIAYQGVEEDDNPTNRNICRLLESIGIQVALPPNPYPPGSVFFTNAVLCLKAGRLGGPVLPVVFKNCSQFLRQQVELVTPKVVVTLGYPAYRSLITEFGHIPLPTMAAAVQAESVKITDRTSLVPVMHPGYWGFLNRPFEQHITDWRRVRAALDKPQL